MSASNEPDAGARAPSDPDSGPGGDWAGADLAYLRSPEAIRARAEAVLAAGLDGRLTHFEVRLSQLEAVAAYVAEVTRAAYPDLAIPYHSRWGHFGVGGIDRMAEVDAALAGATPTERGAALFDLVITSVLLDAGAGMAWRYRETETGQVFARSEGLAVASLRAFLAGAFSSDPTRPLQADATGLAAVDGACLGVYFQAGPGNPLVGVDGRAAMMQRLGAAVAAAPHLFAPAEGGPGSRADVARLGGLFERLRGRAQGGALPAREILAAVLEGLGSIWQGPVSVGGVGLGDVWPHPAAGPDGLMPFHKLAQWLSYSLVEPLEWAGVEVTSLDQLTGLAEYRNGGLFVDLGVLVPKHDQVCGRPHPPGAEVIVEWRALTIALLDRLAEPVRRLLGRSAAELPLTKILEGGTWRAGRKIAAEKRADGGPPIRIDSDGTVF
ncbi:URC4/urg3 family protein [Haliangium sp.]|uniref:URC4/urg3 family protein n=1 Tax=Haliangium sp. TaxID=2663208 RepID=UPI003D0DED08